MINDHEVKNLFSKNNKFSTIFDELIKVNKKPSDFSDGFYLYKSDLLVSILYFLENLSKGNGSFLIILVN